MFKLFKKKKKIVEEYSKVGESLTKYEIHLLYRKKSICPNCKNKDFTTIGGPYDTPKILAGNTYHCHNCGMMYNIWYDSFSSIPVELLRAKNHGQQNKFLDKKLSRKSKINILINKIKNDK
jgi:transposase-like protein